LNVRNNNNLNPNQITRAVNAVSYCYYFFE